MKVHPTGDIVTEGGDAGDGVNEYVEAGRVSDRNRLSDVEGTGEADEGEEIPLPWHSTDESDAADDDEGPETFEDLRFVGPKTAEALESSEIELSDFVRKRISYRNLTEIGVNPGVAAKIRREHSLSWSFDAADTDLSRRSTQVRGLDDEERAWIAASSTGWGDDESDADESGGDGDRAAVDRRTESAEADARPDGRRPTDADPVDESTWRERAASASADSGTEGSGDDATADEETWRSRSVESDRNGASDDAAPEDEEAAWRAESMRGGERDSNVTDEEAAWRSDATGADASAAPEDEEAAWRAESLPTPVTVLDGVEEADARELADAGIRSVRRLATADPESVADALQLDQSLVEGWVRAADERLDGV
ncbi:DUF7409 domain-containing protein [Halopelagius fulvigenes]|uniref:Helix-hairpin-helix domain-containing protein n=1 Tax=Halopelagius fulvigenes TaxID=1198324 RepID=A0ABD5U109_9EURY